MRLELVKRPEHSVLMAVLSPLIALILTVFFVGIVFAILGKDPFHALYVYFISPLTESWTLEELLVKASPLVMIGVGLAVCYTSNVWNIGAEGQFTAGALAGSILPVMFPEYANWTTLPLMLLMGAIGGALYAGIPAVLKTRFGANEILTSLMLVYVAQLFLDWLVRGHWRDPEGYNFPESRVFSDAASLGTFGDGNLHYGIALAVVAVIALAIVMSKTIKGFEIAVLGEAPRAGGFAGFSQKKMVIFAFMLSGALAGIAGIIEIAGPLTQLRPSISPGYGFTAIIVAFLGRLNPVGILLAGLLLALSFLGGEAAQADELLKISSKITNVIQGMLLFFVLACDTLILYRIRFVSGRAGAGSA